jgi:hypothetical protein
MFSGAALPARPSPIRVPRPLQLGLDGCAHRLSSDNSDKPAEQQLNPVPLSTLYFHGQKQTVSHNLGNTQNSKYILRS